MVSVENELKNVGEIDLLSAGFPCQSFSNAGDNKGFDDERGKLFFEIVKFVKNSERLKGFNFRKCPFSEIV